MKNRAPLPTHDLIIEHELIQYLRITTEAKSREEAEASALKDATVLRTHPQHIALMFGAQWAVHANAMRLVDGERPTPPAPPDPAGVEARLLRAMAALTAAHADRGAITDHANHDNSIDDCAICAAFDVLMEEGQAALEERTQVIDDMEQQCDALQGQYATLQAAHTRLQEEYAMLKETHQAMVTAYYTVSLAQLEDADRDPPA